MAFEYYLTVADFYARRQCTAAEHAAFHRTAPVTGGRRANQPTGHAGIAARRRRLHAASKPAKTANHEPLQGVAGAKYLLRFLQQTHASPRAIMAAQRELIRELAR